MTVRKKFGEILIEAGVLDRDKLDQALAIQRNTKGRIGKILEEMRVISEREIAAVLARQFGFRTVRNLGERHFSRDLLALVPVSMAVKHQVFPVRLKGRELFLAMVNPLDIEALDAVSFQAGLRITPCVTTPSEVHAAIERHYEQKTEGVTQGAQERPRILLVEPLDPLRRDLSEVLCRSYEVAEARDGDEALQICKHLKPCALLTATLLPRSDGLNLMDMIRKQLSQKALPAIALSASATIQEEVRCLEAGFSDYLSVPVHPQRLLARVARALTLLPA